MPVVATAPYPLANDVLNLARAIVNDAAQTIEGNLLSNTQPYTFVYLNQAYRYLQDELADNGIETFAKEQQLLNLPAAGVLDPAITYYISYTGCYNGAQMFANPVLPVDMIVPLRLWERQAGSLQSFCEMRPTNDGLPSIGQTTYLRYWEWRNDQIYLLGATQSLDLRVRYVAYLDELLDESSMVMILRSENVLAALTAAAYGAARGSPLAETWMQQAEKLVQQFVSRSDRKKQRAAHRRRPFCSRRTGW